jgi:hypothetical protein
MVSVFVDINTDLIYTIALIKEKHIFFLHFIHSASTGMFWGLTQFFLLFCVTGSCNAARDEAKLSAILLQKLLLTELHPATAEEVQLVLQQVGNRKVRFTAWDFFTINYATLGSIAGGITTLLVIFVQIQNAD